MKSRILVLSALVVVLGSAFSGASAQSAAAKAAPPGIPTVSLNNVARHGFFYAGGKYVGELGADKESTMGGAMYVEVMVPKQIRSPYPVVFFHGAGQTGVDWLQTPDGRPGWAYNFLDMGYVVYLTDFPTRGRSQYVPGVDGTPERPNLNIRTAPNLEEIFTAAAAKGNFPQAKKHSAWPGTGRMGDKVFDDFAKTQVQFLAGPAQETMTRDAYIALLDMVNTPVILLTHSQGGAFGWLVADARPNLVKAIMTLEPAAPPIRGVDQAKLTYNPGGGLSWGVANSPIAYEPAISDPKELQTVLETQAPASDKVPCYVQQQPARKLKNLQSIPVLFMVGEGSYHRIYDHCLARWLNEAGVKTEYVEMEIGRPPRQRAHDDAREEQRRHREVHGQLADQERPSRRGARATIARCPARTSRPSRPTTSRARASSSPAASTGARPAARSCAARCTPKSGCRGRSARRIRSCSSTATGRPAWTGSRRRTTARAGRTA